MSTLISNSAFAASIAHKDALNAYQDIVWSLQYALCGTNAQGGFCTFLYDASVAMLTGGGIGASLGFAPSQNYIGFASLSGLSGAALGIGFDTHGLFALSGNGKTSGLSANFGPALTIRAGSNFAYLTSIALSSLDSTFAFTSSSLAFNTLRFRLHDAGSAIEIARFVDEAYQVILDYPVTLNASPSSFYKVGVSYAAPLCGIATSAKFGIKNFHVEGFEQQPIVSTPFAPTVYKFPVVQNLSIETPSSIRLRDAATSSLLGPYVPIEPPAPDVTTCPNLCLDPFVLVLVLDQSSNMGTRGAQLGLQVLKDYAATNTVKKVSIISFGDTVCQQTITFDSTVQEAIDFLLAAAEGRGSFYCQSGSSSTSENGVDALYLAANILKDYETNYNKYVYFVTDKADFYNNTYSAFDASDALNAYCDKAWMIIGSEYSDSNSLYTDYIAETTVVKYDYFPSCPAAFKAYCNVPVRGAGAKGVYNYAFNAGSQTGPYNITYSNSSAPARFTAIWGPTITSSCFIGNETYNAALTALGYAPINTTALSGTLNITKGNATPADIKIMVEAPIEDSNWQFEVQCYGE